MSRRSEGLQPVCWPAWRQPARQMLRALLGEIEGLPVTGGEASVRLSEAGIDSGRWLAGFSPVGVSARRLDALPQRLGMPPEDAAWFVSHWRRARQIGLALEQTREQVVAKVYLEYPLPAPDRTALPPDRRQVALQIQSAKWTCDRRGEGTAPASRHTEYWRLSGVDGPTIVQLLRDDPLPRGGEAYAAMGRCLQLAQERAPQWHDVRLLLVRDSAGQGRGAGVRFYGSGLKAGHLLEVLQPVCMAWGLDLNRRPDVLASWADQELGWLHASLNGQGQPSLVVYSALSVAQLCDVLSAPWGDVPADEPRAVEGQL